MRKPKNISHKITNWIGSTQSLILHSLFFIFIFGLAFFDRFSIDDVLLILTTAVSLEAIYLAIFIQITINEQAQSLEEVSDDIDELQKDVEEISEDVDEIQKDVEEISEEDDEEEREEQLEKEQFQRIENTLQTLLEEIEKLKRK